MSRLALPETPQDWEDIRALCAAYLDHLGAADPGAAAVLAANYPQAARAALMADLPLLHTPPSGLCLLVRDAGDRAIGTGGYVQFDAATAELKRVYVSPQGQGNGLGRVLVTALIDGARDVGYASIVLDTMHFLTPAIRLYLDLGFIERAGYLPSHATLGPLVRCFEKDLTQ